MKGNKAGEPLKQTESEPIGLELQHPDFFKALQIIQMYLKN